MKKNLFALLAILLAALPALSCPLCAKNQPKGFANITHGAGPGGPFDYVMLYGSIIVVILTMGLFLRFLLRPEGHRNQARREHLSFT